MILIEEFFDLEFFSSDAVCFVPMNFGIAFVAVIQKAYGRDSSQFTPTSSSEKFSQAFDISDISTNRYNLDIFNCTD